MEIFKDIPANLKDEKWWVWEDDGEGEKSSVDLAKEAIANFQTKYGTRPSALYYWEKKKQIWLWNENLKNAIPVSVLVRGIRPSGKRKIPKRKKTE